MKDLYSKKIQTLLKNTALYSISNFSSKIFAFLIVPLYTYYLTTSEYGTYDTIYSVIGLITPMCILAMNEGLLRWLLKSDEKDETIISTGFSLCIAFVTITNVLLIIIFQACSWEYSGIFAFCLTTSTFSEVMQFIARGVKKNFEFAISGVLQTFLMLGANIIFVVILHFGINGMLLSFALSHLMSSLYLIFVIRKKFARNLYAFDKKLAKDMLRYSIMLVPNNVSWWIMNASDRLMLTAMLGSNYTGIYSIACKFPSLLSMMHTIFYRAWQEQAVIEYDSESRNQYYSKIFNSYMRVGCCAVLLLIPISKLYISLFMSADYQNAYCYIGVLMLGALFSSFSGFYGTGYISAKDTKNAMLTTTIGAIVNFGINLLFIRFLGIWAACLSTLLGYLAMWIVRIYQTKKYFSISVKWNEFYALVSVAIIYSVVVILKDDISVYVMLLVALVITGVVNRKIILKLMNMLKKSNLKGD